MAPGQPFSAQGQQAEHDRRAQRQDHRGQRGFQLAQRPKKEHHSQGIDPPNQHCGRRPTQRQPQLLTVGDRQGQPKDRNTDPKADQQQHGRVEPVKQGKTDQRRRNAEQKRGKDRQPPPHLQKRQAARPLAGARTDPNLCQRHSSSLPLRVGQRLAGPDTVLLAMCASGQFSA